MSRRNLTLARITETDLNIVLGLLDDLTQNLDPKGRLAVSALLSGALSLKDADLTIVDDADGTKRFQFQASGISSGAKRTVTVPDADTNVPVASYTLTYTGPTAPRTVTYPDANFSAARIDAAQTFQGIQTFAASIAVAGTTITNGGAAQSFGGAFVANSATPSATGTVLLTGDGVVGPYIVGNTLNDNTAPPGMGVSQAWRIAIGSSNFAIAHSGSPGGTGIARTWTDYITIDRTTAAVSPAGAIVSPFDAGAFTIATGKFSSFEDEVTISGTNEITMAGTAVLGVR